MIYLSAGHHQEAQGAVWNGTTEWKEAQIWQSSLAYYMGGSCMCVPSGLLRHKTDFINKYANQHDLAIEIHFNADSQHAGKGCEALYYPGSKRGKKAAKEICNTLSAWFPPNRGAKEGWYRMDKSNGVDWFLAKTVCTAVIIEPEFIHHIHHIRENMDECCAALAHTLKEIHYD